MNRTGWYSGDQKPARPGVYERMYPLSFVNNSLWDGDRWFVLPATQEGIRVSAHQNNLPWRGLTKEHK